MRIAEYLDFCKSWKKKIVIYGAGKIGKALKTLLEKNNIFPDAFVVSDKRNNKTLEDKLAIVEFDDYVKEHEIEGILVLVAVKRPWNEEIVRRLKQFDKLMYLDFIPDLLELDIKPKLFEINAVVGCCISCKYCPQELLRSAYNSDRVLSLQLFQRIIKKIPKERCIAFSGFSEPFLNPNMTQMIKMASLEGHDIWINSTLVGLTEDRFREIRDVPISNFTLHLPDSNRYANIPMTEEYYRVLRMVIDWTQTYKGNERSVVTKANGQGDLPEEIRRIIEGKVLFHTELADRAGNLAYDSLHSIGVHKGPIMCNYSPDLSNFVMMPNGDVYLCCMDFGLRHYLGNIDKQSYSDICESEELAKVKKAMQSEFGACLCRSCTEASLL